MPEHAIVRRKLTSKHCAIATWLTDIVCSRLQTAPAKLRESRRNHRCERRLRAPRDRTSSLRVTCRGASAQTRTVLSAVMKPSRRARRRECVQNNSQVCLKSLMNVVEKDALKSERVSRTSDA